jgi:hypothetical protein
MVSKFFKYFAAFAVAACFTTAASAISCPTGQQDYNGVCKYLRTTSTTPAPFVPVAVKNKDNIYLYPTVMPSKCATAQADSDCMVAYSYTDTSLPPVITASFTNTAPVAGSTSTSPQWASTNAVSMSISCSGVASSMAGSIAVQGTPSGITFTSTTAGSETCILSATNPFGISSSATISVAFAAPPVPPTITFTRTPLPLVAGSNQTAIWSTTNATSVSGVCTSSGTGYTYTGPLALSGNSIGVASAAWIGYPTHCVWTATGPGGTASAIDDFTTVAPKPTISVTRTPLPFTAGQNQTIGWSTTNATSVNQVCTSTGTGYTFNGPQALSGGNTSVASAAWVGYPTHCVWTATGSGGTATAIDDFTTLPAAAPTISVTRTNGLPMQYPGITGSVWSSTNATSVTLVCTSSNGGYTLSLTTMALSGTTNGATSAAWVGKTSVCTWTASGYGGSVVFTETLTTVNPPPTISVTRTNGLPMQYPGTTGSVWSSTNATSITLVCTSSNGGFTIPLTTMALSGTTNGATSAAWVGKTTTCTWTASGLGGSAVFTEVLTTVNTPPTISVTRTNGLPMKYPGTTGSVWSSTNATSVVYACTSTNGGYTLSPTSMGLSGSGGGATLASWVGKTSLCTWTATGAGGTAVYTETLTTINTPPTISLSRGPLPLTVGQNYSITWSTTNTTSINVVCTSSGTGYTYSGPQATSGSGTGQPSAAWIGYPTHCVWTATGPGGTATAIDDFSTIAALVVPKTPVWRMNVNNGTYFYTASVAQRDALVAAYGWTNEGQAFQAYTSATAVPGLTPVYQYYNTWYGGRFWTNNAAEIAGMGNYPQYVYEGIAWYAQEYNAAGGAIPLYRFYISGNDSYFYTANLGEAQWVIANIPSWYQDGYSQYVWP